MEREQGYTLTTESATELRADASEAPEIEVFEAVELDGWVELDGDANGTRDGVPVELVEGEVEAFERIAAAAVEVEARAERPVEGRGRCDDEGDAMGDGRRRFRVIPGGVGSTGDNAPCSERSEIGSGAPLAPSHNLSTPPRATERKGDASTGSTAGARTRRADPRADSPLRGVSTGARCDETGGGPGVASAGDLRGAVTPRRYDGGSTGEPRSGDGEGDTGLPVEGDSRGSGGDAPRTPSADHRKAGRGKARPRAEAPAAPVGVGSVPDGDGGPRVLRCALDWSTVLCLVPVTLERWVELGRLADAGVAELVNTTAGAVPVEVRRIGKDLVGKSVAGLYLLLREPDGCNVRGVSVCGVSGMTARVRACGGSLDGDGGRCVTPVELAEGLDAVLDEVSDIDRSVCGVPYPGRCSRDASDPCVALGLRRDRGDDVRDVYGVELQVQGEAFSSVESGGDALLAALWSGVVEWLHAGRWPGLDVATVLDPFTRMGRVDIAVDTAFERDPGGRAVQWGIFADGSHDALFRRWSTRARKHRSEETVKPGDDAAAGARHVPISGRRALLGKATAGRTAYLGSAEYVLVCTYERSKKRDGDWATLGPTLKRCGWDGESEVLRCEFRASRRWMGDQVLAREDGTPMFPRSVPEPGEPAGLRASELTLSQFLRALPALVAEFPSRFRHTDPKQDGEGAPRVRDRRSSAWWSGVEAAARAWRSGSGDVARVVSTRRHAAAKRTVTAVRSGLLRLVALRGVADLSGVLPEVFEAWHEPDFATEREALLARVRGRYAVPAPAARGVAAVAATG